MLRLGQPITTSGFITIEFSEFLEATRILAFTSHQTEKYVVILGSIAVGGELFTDVSIPTSVGSHVRPINNILQ